MLLEQISDGAVVTANKLDFLIQIEGSVTNSLQI